RPHLRGRSPLAPPPGPVRGGPPWRHDPLPCASPPGAASPAALAPGALRLSPKTLSRLTERLWHFRSNRVFSDQEVLTPGPLRDGRSSPPDGKGDIERRLATL